MLYAKCLACSKKTRGWEERAGGNRGPSGTKIESNKVYRANHFIIPIE